MRKFLKIHNLLAILLVASLALAGTSCKKKKVDPPTPDTPPALAAIESLEMDFSDFDYLPVASKIIVDTYDNYTVAYNNVNFWSVLMDDIMAIPIASYKNALTRTGQETTANTFEWTLSFSASAVNYVGTLVAVKGSSTFSLTMNVAPSASPTNTFKYFDAVVNNDLSHATWNIYKDDMGSVKVLTGEWNEDSTTGFESLEFTYVEPGQTETNSSVEYSLTPGNTYNGAYYMTMSAGDVDVEWSTITKAGHVQSLGDFADLNWYCWNDVLGDITCPAK